MNLLRYFHTIKYLKPGQVFWRLVYRSVHPTVLEKAPPLLRKAYGVWHPWVEKPPQLVASDEIILLNVRKNIHPVTIWNNPDIEKLWLYNLHYFDDLNAQDALTRQTWHKNLILRWIKENPMGRGNGWEPYTISLRVVNWLKWLSIVGCCDDQILQSLATQIRFLNKRIEWHLLGNHLLANAKALVFAGLFFRGKEAAVWFRKGMRILRTQLSEQVLTDGGHFELSPMYHAIVLEDLLDLYQWFQLYQEPFSAAWVVKIKAMLGWLETMTHPDGEIAFFNDAALHVAPTFKNLHAYAMQLLGERMPISSSSASKYLQASGYCVANLVNARLFIDVGAIGPGYLPGHAHADSLSFELSLDGQRIFVNSGTSTYGDSALRHFQRSTLAHNTICVNQQDSSEMWGAFRAARRAKVFLIKLNESAEKIELSAKHNGYCRLKNPIIHERRWCLTENQLMVEDFLQGRGSADISLNFYLHPHVQVSQISDSKVRLSSRVNQIFFETNFPLQLHDSFYYPEFNRAIPNKKLMMVMPKISLPAYLISKITWDF